MPRLPMNKGQGFEIGVDYNASNGRITGVYCNNSGPFTEIFCWAVLTNGQRFGNTDADPYTPGSTPIFGLGQNQLISIPGTAVRVVALPDGEFDFQGLAYVSSVPRN
jgi:hypothetical protein